MPTTKTNSPTVPLTLEQEKEILKWCHENPDTDMEPMVQKWRKKFNCSDFSIAQVFVKEALGQIKL